MTGFPKRSPRHADLVFFEMTTLVPDHHMGTPLGNQDTAPEPGFTGVDFPDECWGISDVGSVSFWPSKRLTAIRKCCLPRLAMTARFYIHQKEYLKKGTLIKMLPTLIKMK